MDVVRKGAEKIHTSSADCLGPLAAAAAYDMFVDMRVLLKNERLCKDSLYTHGRCLGETEMILSMESFVVRVVCFLACEQNRVVAGGAIVKVT